MFLLKGVRPNKYRDNATLRHEFQGPTLLVGPRAPPALEPALSAPKSPNERTRP